MVRLCRADLHRARLRIHRRAEVPVPPGLIQPSLRERNLGDPAGLTELVREAARKARCRGWVRVVLADPIFMLRTIATDELPARRDEARQFLRWQARDLLPFPAEEARLDYVVLTPGTDGRQRVACLMARDRILTEYERALEAAGLRAAVLDARSIGLAQAAAAFLGRETTGLVVVDGARTTLVVIHEGRPRFWRILPEGQEAWGRPDRARLLREVMDSIAFYRESEGTEQVSQIALGGLGQLTAEVAAALTEWLGVPAAGLNLGVALRVNGDPDDLLTWGAALGAAIRSC
jgi:Tfp pilus assembly PilM family ATPase